MGKSEFCALNGIFFHISINLFFSPSKIFTISSLWTTLPPIYVIFAFPISISNNDTKISLTTESETTNSTILFSPRNHLLILMGKLLSFSFLFNSNTE